jgi:hypothetical protein
MQKALKVAVAVALAALLSLTLGGCELLDPNDEAFAPLDSGPVSKPAAQPAPEAAAPNVSGDLKLTFAGTPPAPGAFSIPNTTMVLAKDGTLKASKTVTFVPAQTNGTGKDVWVFDCTESQSGAIAGTASYKRTMQWVQQGLRQDRGPQVLRDLERHGRRQTRVRRRGRGYRDRRPVEQRGRRHADEAALLDVLGALAARPPGSRGPPPCLGHGA